MIIKWQKLVSIFLIPLSASSLAFKTPLSGRVSVSAIMYPPVEKVAIKAESAQKRPILSEGSLWTGNAKLKTICSCESWGRPDQEPRQFDKSGNPLWGRNPKLWNTTGATTTDVGGCQINTTVHAKEIEEMGLDVINSLEDNVAFAKYLYKRDGFAPWNPSKNCWQTKEADEPNLLVVKK